MPWNDQSGGSSGGGDKGGGPWGSGPRKQQPWGQQPPPRPGGGGGGGPAGPDLEEMLRRLGERMRGAGGGDGRRIGAPRGVSWPIIAGVLLFGWLMSGIYFVNEGQRGVITLFGQYVRTDEPGMRYHLPLPIESARIVQFTNQQILEVGYRGADDMPGESQMITGDRNIVDIDFRVFYRVSNAYDYVFKIDDQSETIRGVAESAMREVIGQRPLEEIITRNRAGVEQSVQALMQEVLNSYEAGVEVAQVQLQRAGAPQQVAAAFLDVVSAAQDAQRTQNEARSYANQQVPVARGQAAQIVQDAQAYRERVVREANGEASRFTQVYDQYRLAPRVTRDRIYLETMERIYRDADTIILDQRAGAVPYMPLEGMRRSTGPVVTAPQQPQSGGGR